MIENPAAILRLRYIIGLAVIALLVSASWVTLHTIVSRQENFSNLINIAGDQRRLSERIALYTLTMAVTDDETEFRTARSQLGRAVNALRQAHVTLLQGDTARNIPFVMTPVLESIYFDPTIGLDTAIQRFGDRAMNVYETPMESLSTNTGDAIYVLQYGPHAISAMFDSLVDEYESIATTAIQQVAQIETALWLAALLTLLLEFMLIYRPMERRVHRGVLRLREANGKLEENVAELMRAQHRLTASEERFRAMAANVPGVIFQLAQWGDGRRNFSYVSPRCKEYFGVSERDLRADWRALKLHEEDLDNFDKIVTEAQLRQAEWTFEGRVKGRDGNEKWLRCEATPSSVVTEVCMFNGVITDITPQKELEAKLRFSASTDPLTKAFNRRYFVDAAEQEIYRMQRYRHPMALISLDLDRFKSINDIYGHAGGDETLRQFVTAVSGVIRTTDTLARIGGEEFCVLLPDTDEGGALAIAERVRLEVESLCIGWSDTEIRCTTSIGVAVWQPDDPGEIECPTLDELLHISDEALYRAKHGGRNQVVLGKAAERLAKSA